MKYLTAALLGLFLSANASASTMCFPRAAMEDHLLRKFEETVRAAGIAANGQLAELYASPDFATWTLTVTSPDGSVCVLASGENWTEILKQKEGNPA